MAYQRRSPDYTEKVAEVARRFPVEWDLANKEKHGHRTADFVRILAWELHREDPNVGLNGKRGNVHDPSHDAIAYKNASAPGGVEVIDFIVGAGHRPAWQDVTIPPHPHPMNRPGEHPPEGVLGAFIPPEPHGKVPIDGGGAGGNTGGEPVDPDIRQALVTALEQLADLRGKVQAAAERADSAERKVNRIAELLPHLVAVGNTGSRGSGWLSHYHEATLPLVDGRTLKKGNAPAEADSGKD